ncbi:cytochrome P450 [Micromonospora sp. RP3T]|uniref:cytochrome P450 n=1 Tax=Micromonospora sp. RP3T TaxID=2135446 RepID=UPI001E3DE6EA|nr:cytochrome P450 [Micromonospora sp. RP3T]
MPRAKGCPLDPPPGLRGLQAEAPLVRIRLWDGSTPWLVTRHDVQRALLADERIGSDSLLPGYPHVSESFQARAADLQTFITMDDPEHARQRRMLSPSFTLRRIEQLRPTVQGIVDDLVDGLLAGPKPADLVSAFALPVPSLVICHVLGVPYEDHEFFQRTSRLLIARETAAETALAAQMELVGYLDQLIGRKLAEPADDLLSQLAVEQLQTGQMSRQQLAMMSLLLLVGGHETSADMIALGTLALLTNPDQLAVLRHTDDPTVIARATEELLRYLSVAHGGRRRVALEDIEIAGEVIRAGEGLVLPSEIGDRDERVYPRPDVLDLHRDARQHLAFGFGIHQCLGQPLVRVELQAVYGTLYRRIPTLALAVEPSELEFKEEGFVYGVHELPVTW